MVTRQSELQRVLNLLSEELPSPEWVALVDHDGLVVACVPADPPVSPESLSAMTAASLVAGERVLKEIDGGQARYISMSGSRRQILTIVLGRENLLSIGLGPEISPRTTFGTLSRRVPELLEVIQKRFTRE